MSAQQSVVSIASVENYNHKGDVTRLLSDLRDQHEREFDFRRRAEINQAWYSGKQTYFWNPEIGRIVPQQNPYHRVRMIVNLMRGQIESFAAKLAFDRLVLESESRSDDIEDFFAAELQNALLTYWSDRQDFQTLAAEADMGAILSGEWMLKVTWNPDLGRPLRYDLDESRFSEQDLQDLRGGLYEGDVEFCALGPYEYAWGPAGVQFKDAEWIFEQHDHSVAYVMDRYKLKRQDVQARDADSKLYRPGRVEIGGPADGGDLRDECVPVSELWIRPNQAIRGLERGRCCILVGEDRLVKNIPNPYRHGELPYRMERFLVQPDDPRGQTWVSDMIPVQHDYNRALSQFAENRELMANPTWLAQLGSITSENEWDNKPGGIKMYTGAAPQLVQGAAMPSAVMIQMERDRKDIQDISGIRDVSQGKNPAGVRSAKSIIALKESDDDRIAPIAFRRRRLWSEAARLALLTARQYMTEPRILHVKGDESQSETIELTGADLGSIEACDVHVMANGRIQSHSARIEMLDMAIQRGILAPAQNARDRRVAMDILQMGVAADQFNPVRQARRIQMRRNLAMARGRYRDPLVTEDHETMLEEMRSFQQRPFYADLKTHELFERYEAALYGMMAIQQPRQNAMIQQALQQAGIVPDPPQNSAPGPALPLDATPPASVGTQA